MFTLALLEGLSAVDALQLDTIFGWALAAESAHPITSEHSAAALGWPETSPERAESTIRAALLDFLQGGLRDIRAFRGSGRVHRAQILEHKQLRAEISANGTLVYGIRCTCSPESLDALVAEVRGLKLRVLESKDPLIYQYPIWPVDPLRDLIIETRGRYGR